jgi:superfamily II DNA or RNA helicase
MFNLRYYQTEAKDAVFREWDSVQSTAVIMATATGKTELYLSIATDPILGRVLIIAHRDYLLAQPIRRLQRAGFDDIAIEKADFRSELNAVKNKVVFASIQSLAKPSRLATFDPFKFDAVVIDEAHRTVARTYRTVLDHFKKNPKLKVLLLTATPKRKDGIALGTVCDSVAYSYGPETAIAEGWIVPIRFFRREVADLDFSTVKLRSGDLDAAETERLMLEEKPLHELCASLAEDRGPTVIFCPGVAVAQAYSALMNSRYRRERSTVLWQESTDEQRELAGKQLAHGDLDYLFNCDLVTEGYDVPELCRVVWAAPTASLVRFTQGTGRVFRTHGSLRTVLVGGRGDAEARKLAIQQSPKPLGLVVTYYPQNCKHKLCEPTDILGGSELPEEIRAFTKEIQEQTASQDRGSAPEEDVETATAFVAIRKLLEKRREKIRASASVGDYEYDAFGHQRVRNIGDTGHNVKRAAKAVSSDWPAGKASSPKMISWLKAHGVPAEVANNMTAWQSYTVRQLVSYGVTAETALSWGKKQALTVLAKFKVLA